ncbi:MAG: DUF4410 domain-containing protein [Candidatus Methylacidiphilales bacterium]|nr:DUF4410 domain-containing protein [Candidatus Methylacidiphilales bacterium]
MASIKALPTLTVLALVTFASLFVAGCGSINTEPVRSSTVRLRPAPPVIYVAPFDTRNTQWLIGNERPVAYDKETGLPELRIGERNGYDRVDYKKDFVNSFLYILTERLQKIAPTYKSWKDDLPDHGWMIGGEFKKVYQGSRALRTAFGFGAGETTLQTRVYVYDLSVSKTRYVLSFDTGVPYSDKGKHRQGYGSGPNPPGDFGSGLTLDMSRTAREIRDILMTYY